MSWPTVGALARTELRRAARSLLVIGLLASVVGATTVSALSLARRTTTAYERLGEATGVDDARGGVHVHDDLVDEIVALPEVDERWTGRFGIAQLEDAFIYLGITAGPEQPSTLLTPVVLDGRLPRPTDDDVIEIALRDDFQREVGVELGTEIGARFLTEADYFRFDTGFEGGRPNGPERTLRVVGTVRVAGGYATMPPAFASPDALDRHADAFGPAATFFVTLRQGRGAFDRFERAVAELAEGRSLPPEAEEFRVADVSDTAQADAGAEHTAGLLGRGLLALALAVGGIGWVALAQAYARQHATGSADRHTQSALGVTSGQQRAAHAIVALVPAAMAAAVTLGVAWATSSIEPIGAVRNYEPNPGRALNVAAIAAGTSATFAVVVATALLTSLLAGRAWRVSTSAESRVVAHAARVGGGPAGVSGLRFALEPGRGARAVPVRSAVSGAVIGITGVVAGLVFSSSLDRLVTSPARTGIPYDVLAVDTPPAVIERLVDLPEASTVVVVTTAPLELDGAVVTGHAIDARRGELDIDVQSGRLPRTPDEVLLGLRVADDLDKAVGDTVTAVDGSGRARDLAVVGTAVVPTFNGEQLGLNALVTPEGLQRSGTAAVYTETALNAAPGTDPDDLEAMLAETLEASRSVLPTEVANLRELGRLPELVAGLVGLVALVALAHALVLLVRRRSADLALLRTIGFTRRQTAVSVVVMAAAITTTGVVLGVPLGLAVGSSVWEVAATGAFVTSGALVRWTGLAAVAGCALLVAIGAAALPARRASAASPAELLRAE